MIYSEKLGTITELAHAIKELAEALNITDLKVEELQALEKKLKSVSIQSTVLQKQLEKYLEQGGKYYGGKGIDVSEGAISIKIPDTEEHLYIDSEGLHYKEDEVVDPTEIIDEAISTALTNALDPYNKRITSLEDSLEGLDDILKSINND